MTPSRIGLALALLALVVLAPVRAHAQDAKPSYRIVIDRVEHSPASIGGTRLQIFLSAQSLQGQRLDLAEPNSVKTFVGGSELKAPYALGTYRGTGTQTALVIVVQATIDYGEVLPTIIDSLDTSLLGLLDDKTQFAILPYGESVGTGKLAPLKTARTKLAGISQDGSAGDPALIETVERAMLLLKKAKTTPEGLPLRKIVVVIGDGRDRVGDKDRVTRLGVRAAKEGVRIHALAYSPTDQRRPLLLLGELSRKSFGTFRWLQLAQADSWAAKLTQLHDEIDKQYVLTYFVAAEDDPSGKKLKVSTVGRTEATGLNESKVPAATCNKEPCAGYCVGTVCAVPKEGSGAVGGILRWVVLIGGGAVGLAVLLGFIGWAMSKRAAKAPAAPGAIAVPGSIPPPARGFVPGSAPPGLPVVQTAFLMFLGGPRAGERVALTHGFTVGKAPNCHLVIDDGYTSTYHVQIGIDGTGTCHLFDQQSTNGTTVNGVRVTQHVLRDGDTVRIGATDLRFLAQ